MRVNETISNLPIGVEKSVRGEETRAISSARAGFIQPVTVIPTLREDATSGSLSIQLAMDETIHPLMNAINVTAYAHFVPMLAFDRFKEVGIDAYNRSYQGVGEPHNDVPIPYFETMTFDRAAPFWKTLGIHWKQGTAINTLYLEAYNTLVNYRRRSRSKHLPLRTKLDTTLAQAFWKNPNMSHIVPDFDDAAMDGEVELQWTTSQLIVEGIGKQTSATPFVNAGLTFVDAPGGAAETWSKSIATNQAGIGIRTNADGVPHVWAELANAGVKVSLANIELAKKTAAFAKLQEQYRGMDEAHLMDLLMEGVRVPDQDLKEPILLDRKSTIFGYAERYATDGANLDKSVTTGQTELRLNFTTPAMNVAGVIVVTLEIVPEQLYERQKDMLLGYTSPNALPNFLRDYLDPQKVEVVTNSFVDVEHATPNGTFGYAPLNHHWKRSITRVGGKYYRPAVDTFIEDRQRFWSVEKLNPALTADFYLVNSLPHTVFADMLADPFEILTLGNARMIGNTVFGQALEEDHDEYDYILNQIDQTRLKP